MEKNKANKNKNNQFTKNLLICGDNLKALDDLKKQGIKVDLIYLDPPFFSNRHYEVVWGDEAEVRSFKDRWAGGIHVYIEWMRERVVKMYDILKDTGSFYLHCDTSASHYLKIMLDDIFSHQNFRSEIIWKRSSAHSDTKQGRMQHGRIHDTLFFYTKSDSWAWNPVYAPYDQGYINRFYKHVEEDTGRKYQLDNIAGPGDASKGNPKYEVMGVTRYWRYSKKKMEELINQGRIVQTRSGTVPRYKRYLDEMPGVPLQDMWIDINPISSHSSERLGYPTQKPEALLERIIKASSNEGDIVLDPFCGCGTAMAVAHRLKRKWMGIDISPTAIILVEKRLEQVGAISGKDFDSIGMPTTLSELKALEHFEFQNWVVNEMQAKQSPRKSGDEGIDGHIEKSLYAEEAGIQVKQSEKIGRNTIDNFETALERKKYKRGYVVGFSFTKNAHEEAARVREDKGLYIKLISVEDLLKRKSGLLK